MLKDWTTYVFAGIVVAGGLSILWYEVNFDVYQCDQPSDKQWNEPELETGMWRLGHLPNHGAPVEVGMFAVFKWKGTEGARVSRIVAVEGQKVAVKGDEVLVDGTPLHALSKQAHSRLDVPEITIPRGHVFLLNDERAKGPSCDYDSRRLGPIPVEAITHVFKPLKGKV